MNSHHNSQNRNKTSRAVRIILIIVLLQGNSAHAYLDPGSGSMLLQGLIAALAIVGGGISMFWGKVTSIFRKQSPKNNNKINKAEKNSIGLGDDGK